MLAVLGGLGAALAWALATTCSARSARLLGAGQTVAWVMLVGLAMLAIPLALTPLPHITTATGLWLAAGGIGNVAGLTMAYRALRVGQVGVVAPILSAEGAVTALIAVIAGASVAFVRAVGMALVVAGVLLTASGPRRRGAAPAPHPDLQAALWASAAAVSFGAGLYGTGRAGAHLPLAWAVLPPRLVGAAVLTLPLALRSALRLTRPALPLVLLAGVGEVAGFLAYAAGARHNLPITAVVASLTGAIAAGFGRLAYRERLRPAQLAGVATIVAGVALLSALGA
jgi:drug/metabolite transporter (DMT)-like permease